MDAFIGAMALEETTTADFMFGGVSCHALCCPLPGDEVRALVLIAPRSAQTVNAPSSTTVDGLDLREVLAEWRDPLATMSRARHEPLVRPADAPLPAPPPREG